MQLSEKQLKMIKELSDKGYGRKRISNITGVSQHYVYLARKNAGFKGNPGMRIIDGTPNTKDRKSLHTIFQNIIGRCSRIKNSSYLYYGGRGILCERNSFKEFYNDMYLSYIDHINKYSSKNTTIERVNVNGNYCKENCIWATKEEQSKNTRMTKMVTVGGKVMTLKDACLFLGLGYDCVRSRMKRKNITFEEAINIKFIPNDGSRNGRKKGSVL